MSKYLPPLPMSQIIASDAPLLSPVSAGDASWDHQIFYSPTSTDYAFSYYTLPPSPPHSVGSTSSDSPIPTSRMLKMRMSPESGSESEQQLCVPTHQVFDVPEGLDIPSPPSSSSGSPQPQQRPSITINTGIPPSKRSCSPAPSVTKKPRASGERVNSKDFIPPDVSGLSKREARLVKNRAAAFLSRQRKREEFETMEVRVAELEQENARLLALAEKGNRSSHSRPHTHNSDEHLLSEVEQLRAQLAAAEKRERELRDLNTELVRKTAADDAPVKVEALEPKFPLSSPIRTTPAQTKSSASLGLMVLLCALPTLLSMPTRTALPTSFSFPVSGPSALPVSSSAFDYNSLIPSEYEWSRHPGNTVMDLDDEHGRFTGSSTAPSSRKLEFADIDSEALKGMDISFDTSPSDGGKIRVRIHPLSSASSSSPSSYPSKHDDPTSSSLAMWAGGGSSSSFVSSSDSFDMSQPPSYPPSSSASSSSDDPDSLGPFLGVGPPTTDFGLDTQYGSTSMMYGQGSSADFRSPTSSSAFGFEASDFSGSIGDLNKRRVRIALKSMPTADGEGGEWEVQLC